MNLNKVEEHKSCKKCSISRELAPEEKKKAIEEDKELTEMMKEWGNIE